MRAGQLRHSITIEQPVEVQDGLGEMDRSWETFATVRAAVRPLRGEERVQALQLNAETTHKVMIRYLAGVTEKMRVNFDGRVLAITGILNLDERDRTLELLCSEGVTDG